MTFIGDDLIVGAKPGRAFVLSRPPLAPFVTNWLICRTAEQFSGKTKWTSTSSMTSHVNDFRSPTSRGRSGGNKRTICLWQFLRELLLNPQSHHNWIRWIDRTKGRVWYSTLHYTPTLSIGHKNVLRFNAFHFTNFFIFKTLSTQGRMQKLKISTRETLSKTAAK